MRINDDWEIVSEPLNIILRQRKVTKEKEDKPSHEYWQVEGYYPTPQAALQDMVEKKIMGSGMEDMTTICKAIKDMQCIITRLQLIERG